ncbi:hypothetical protein [Winslowiella toletana]|uniref:hypothetical protein n=1 Tax=Winslowiella toletana TaxID=92490 RepID=UPI0028BD8591|nr:hypothetical protein [Winslowiella toletana]WNN42669.1 hypothetical protein RIN69_13165 [Winslowiella toletana]
MHTENANSQSAFDLLQSPELLSNIASALMPALSAAVKNAIVKALAVNTSATMSKKDFAAANGISKSMLEKWIANGVVLLAPTPTSTVTRTIECKKTGQTRTNVMEKHGNALVNVAAWRETNLQHAINCRYIKR